MRMVCVPGGTSTTPACGRLPIWRPSMKSTPQGDELMKRCAGSTVARWPAGRRRAPLSGGVAVPEVVEPRGVFAELRGGVGWGRTGAVGVADRDGVCTPVGRGSLMGVGGRFSFPPACATLNNTTASASTATPADEP